MKKHKEISLNHCKDCFDKATKRMFNQQPQPTRLLVSPKRYRNLKKYGMVEGWFKNDD